MSERTGGSSSDSRSSSSSVGTGASQATTTDRQAAAASAFICAPNDYSTAHEQANLCAQACRLAPQRAA